MGGFTGLEELYLIEKEITAVVESEVVDIAVEIHEELMDSPPAGTPVDTGWARSNWQIQSGSPPTGTVGSKGNVSDDKALSDREEIKKYKFSDGDVYIQNNVPYIGRLNQGGYSMQSPAFFVDTAVAKVLSKHGG